MVLISRLIYSNQDDMVEFCKLQAGKTEIFSVAQLLSPILND